MIPIVFWVSPSYFFCKFTKSVTTEKIVVMEKQQENDQICSRSGIL